MKLFLLVLLLKGVFSRIRADVIVGKRERWSGDGEEDGRDGMALDWIGGSLRASETFPSPGFQFTEV